MKRCLVLCALLWLPILLFELQDPYPWREIAATPTLRRAFALSFGVWISLATLAAIGATLPTLVLRRFGSGDFRPDVAAAILASSCAIFTREMTANWISPAPEIGLAGVLLISGMAAGALISLSYSSGSGNLRRALEIAWCVVAIVAWLAALSDAIATPSVRQMMAVAFSASGVLAASLLAPGPAQRIAIPIAAMAVIVTLASMPTSSARPRMPQTRPVPARSANVVLIVVDTLRADHMSDVGYPVDTTPNLSGEFRRNATTFLDASSVAVHTVPSVAALFTSRIREEILPTENRVATMAETFDRAGYVTAAFITNGLLNKEFFRRGFREFSVFGGYTYFKSSFLLYRLMAGGDEWIAFQRLRWLRLHKTQAREVETRARRWLERERDRPFFLYLHFLDPHWPYYERGYGLVSETPVEPLSYIDLLRHRVKPSRGSAALDEMIGRYDEEVRSVDESIGRILDDLKELGLRESTLVILTSDHGEEFFEHGRFSHGHALFEEQVRVPLIFSWPAENEAFPHTQQVDVPVSLADVLPTLVDYFELPVTDERQLGHSLRPLIEGAPRKTWYPVRSWGGGWWKESYREGDLKVHFAPDSTEIYDLGRDPHEQHPLVGDIPAHARVIERANAARTRTAREVGDAFTEAGQGERESAEDLSPEQLDDRASEELRVLGYID